MANLTLVIDDDLLRRARIRALEEGTSVNAVVRAYLRTYAEAGSLQQAVSRFLDIAGEHRNTGRASGERSWTRRGLYDERLGS